MLPLQLQHRNVEKILLPFTYFVCSLEHLNILSQTKTHLSMTAMLYVLFQVLMRPVPLHPAEQIENPTSYTWIAVTVAVIALLIVIAIYALCRYRRGRHGTEKQQPVAIGWKRKYSNLDREGAVVSAYEARKLH